MNRVDPANRLNHKRGWSVSLQIGSSKKQQGKPTHSLVKHFFREFRKDFRWKCD